MLWNKYKYAILFIVFTMIGVFIYVLYADKRAWEIYNMIGVATTVSLAMLAFMTYVEYAKGEENIKIYFKTERTAKIYTKLHTQRKHFTRSEVMGLIGMIYNGKTRFNIADFNNNTKILERFEEIQNGKKVN